MTSATLKIGTRGSPLALLQTVRVENALLSVYPSLQIERVVIRTSGDWKPEQGETRLSEAQGGKGLFAREIEAALLNGTIDCAVHSLKDMPSFLPEGLALDHMLERADPRDAFICHRHASLMDLPHGAVVGTSSLRRQAFILARRPDIRIVALRGNVQTRLAKLEEGQVDATYLAMAGLLRLGIHGDFIHPVAVGDMLPACGQATIAIETRESDKAVRDLLSPIHHAETGLVSAMERAALQVLDGSCHTPIGAYARFVNSEAAFDLCVSSNDGTRLFTDSESRVIETADQAIAMGRETAMRLKPSVPADIFV